MADKGRLKIQCFLNDSYIPLDNVKVTVRSSEGGPASDNVELRTNNMGETNTIELDAPPFSYAQQPLGLVPYSMYDLRIEKDGFQSIVINRCQVFPDELSIQQCNLIESGSRDVVNETINIGPNTLNGNYPEKIYEEEYKEMPPPTGGVVLQKPVVPEFIVVHAGGPNNANAPNYTVPYKDYIKNVASCEIYSTWPESTIRANVYAIISFTLNRIYTEWYRGKGKNFDITNSTAYDHAFTYGRNFFQSIVDIVDEIFATYIRRFNVIQPLLAQYCDGKNVSCPGWMTQWGSKYMGDQGRTPYEILTSFYGNDIELVTAEEVQGRPQSYPGYELTIGASGTEVRTAQEFLNRIAQNYPLIPKTSADGVFGPETAEAVSVFQGVFNLPETGVIDYATWYRISDIYVGVTRIAELRNNIKETTRIFIPPTYFNHYDNSKIPKFSYKETI